MKLKLFYKKGEKMSFNAKCFWALFGCLCVGASVYFDNLHGVSGAFELMWTAFTTGRLTW